MTRNELRREFVNTNVPKIKESEKISDYCELMPAVDWVRCDRLAEEKGTYKDEYVEFLEDIILNISRIVMGDGK